MDFAILKEFITLQQKKAEMTKNPTSKVPFYKIILYYK